MPLPIPLRVLAVVVVLGDLAALAAPMRVKAGLAEPRERQAVLAATGR